MSARAKEGTHPMMTTSTRVEDARLRSIIEQGASLIWISADGDELFSAISELLELREAVKPFATGSMDVSGTAVIGVSRADLERLRSLSQGACHEQ